MLNDANWKTRQEAIKWLGANLCKLDDHEQLSTEAAMVILKKKTHDFKEANINIIKDLIDVSLLFSESANPKATHLIIELLLEKLPLNKYLDQTQEMLTNFELKMGLRKLVTSLLINTRDKSSNPKVSAPAISLINGLILKHQQQADQIPFKELALFAKNALQNPNSTFRHNAIELFAIISRFSNDANTKAILAELPNVQKKMISDELVKLNTQLNSSGGDISLHQKIVAELPQAEACSQKIHLQTLINSFKNKKISLPETDRSKLLDFCLLSSAPYLETQINELVLLFARRYKKDFESYSVRFIDRFSLKISRTDGSEYQDALKEIREILSDAPFNQSTEFIKLHKNTRDTVMGVTGMEEEDSSRFSFAQSIEQKSKSKDAGVELDLEVVDFAPTNLLKPLDLNNRLLSKNSTATKIDKQPKEDLVFSPRHEIENDLLNKPLRKPNPLTSTETIAIGASPANPHRPQLAKAESKLPDIKSFDNWKDHRLDTNEPRDCEVQELRALLRGEMGEETVEKMFSYERVKILDSIQKAETRMKQKSELSGYWELILKWVFVRVFDCSRDIILKEFTKMIVRLINFADRGARNFTVGETELIFSIILRIVSNEEGNSVESFSSTFIYNGIGEHKSFLLELFFATLKSPSFRAKHKVLQLATDFLKRTKSLLREEDILIVISQMDQGKECARQAEIILRYLAERIENPNIILEIAERSTVSIRSLESIKSLLSSTVKGLLLSPAIHSLLTDLKEFRSLDQLSLVVTLKKIIDLWKVKNNETDELIEQNHQEILELCKHAVSTNLALGSSLEEKIESLDQGKEEVARAILEYMQKIVGLPPLLKSVEDSYYKELFLFIIDGLLRVDQEKRQLESLERDDKVEKLIKSRETMSKFMNSALMRLIEGPTNKVFNMLFDLLKTKKQSLLAMEEETELKRFKVVVKCLLRICKSIDTADSTLDIPEVFNRCMDYMGIFPTAKEVDKSDLGVKIVKTVINELCMTYKEKTYEYFSKANLQPPADSYIKVWLKTILDADKQSDGISILSGKKSILRIDCQRNEEIAHPTSLLVPKIVHSRYGLLQRPSQKSSDVIDDIEEIAEAKKLKEPKVQILPSPGMPFRPINLQIPTLFIGGADKDSFMPKTEQPKQPHINTEDIYFEEEDLQLQHKQDTHQMQETDHFSLTKPLFNSSRQSERKPDVLGAHRDNFVEVESTEPLKSAPEKQHSPVHKKETAAKQTEINISEDFVEVDDINESGQKNSSKVDLLASISSSLQDGQESDTQRGTPKATNFREAAEEKDREKDCKAFNHSFGGPDHSIQDSVMPEVVDRLPSTFLKQKPSEVLSLGKRSIMEKNNYQEDDIEIISSPTKENSKNRQSIQAAGKFSLNIKDQKGLGASFFERNFHNTFINQPERQPQVVIQPVKSIFSNNISAQNSTNPQPKTQEPLSKPTQEKRNVDISPSKAEDQVQHLLSKFKNSMLCDYTKHILDICDFIKFRPHINISTYMKDLNLVQRGILITELEKHDIKVESKEHLAANHLHSTFTAADSSKTNPISEIYQRIAQIREKYKEQSSHDIENYYVEPFTQTEESRKRIEDLGSKIRNLLGTKSKEYVS